MKTDITGPKNQVYLSETKNLTGTVRLDGALIPECSVKIETHRIKWLSGTTGYDDLHHHDYYVTTPNGEVWRKRVQCAHYLNPRPANKGKFVKLP